MLEDAKPPMGRGVPPWLGNLLVFGVLFVMTVAWFFLQTRQAEEAFLDDAGNHARLLADAVALHARGAVLGEQATNAIVTDSLRGAARFVAYLDAIEPFKDTELSNFADEIGLKAIRVVRADGSNQGPPEWGLGSRLDCVSVQRLQWFRPDHSVVYGVAHAAGEGCVLVALDSRRIETLQRAIGLPTAMRAVAELPGVIGVRLDGDMQSETLGSPNIARPRVEILEAADGVTIAQARVALHAAELVLDMDAHPLTQTRSGLWRGFGLFTIALALAGGLLTALLYRYQQAHLAQLAGYQRRLSRQREEAGLGRAAAAIAHEIRNPLNAMSMGLQRLQIEADELSAEHRELIGIVLQALRRGNDSVGSLLEYARPVEPRRESVRPCGLLDELLALYAGRMAEAGIEVEREGDTGQQIVGDPDLLRQVFDNLLRNALQAQSDGGWLRIVSSAGKDGISMSFSNPGLHMPAHQIKDILQPWFTTKPDGTGLGLAICRRIINAHGGSLAPDSPEPSVLRLRLFLPYNGLPEASGDPP